MGHTNSTANLSLPQFIGTDKPTWLGDVNGAFSAIDSYAGTNDAAVAAAASDASSAISQAAAAVNTANTANTTAGNASTAATAAVTAANQANALSNQIALRTGVLADLHTTDKTSIVNAINEVKDAEGDLADLTTTDKTSIVNAINEVNSAISSVDPITLIATSSSGNTWSQKLAELSSDFSALSADKKARAYLIVSGDTKLSIQQTTGVFSIAKTTNTGFVIQTASFVDDSFYSNSAGTITDLGSSVSADTIALYA